MTFYRNPISAIFSLMNQKMNIKIPEKSRFFQLYSLNQLPQPSQNLISILSKSSDSPFEILAILLKNDYSFPFFPDIVNYFQDLKIENVSDFDFFWIACTSISWCLYFSVTHDEKYAIPVLNSLITSCNNQKFLYYAQSLFVFVFRSIFDYKQSNFEPYLDPFFVFFSKPFPHPKQSSTVIPLVVSKLMNNSTDQINDEALQVLSAVNSWTTTGAIQWDTVDADAILTLLFSYILNLNHFALKFMLSFVDYGSENQILHIFKTLPKSIAEYIINDNVDNPINWDHNVKDALQFEPNPAIEGNIRISTVPVFPNGLHLKPPEFPKDLEIKSMLTPRSIFLQQILIPVLVGKNKLCCLFLAELIKQMDEKINDRLYGNLVASVISIFGSINVYSKASMYLVDSSIFDPTITLFNQSQNYDYLSMIRKLSLHFIIEENIEIIDSLINKIYTYPLMCAEVIYRLATELSIISLDINRIMKSLRLIFLYYRTLDLTETEHKEEIELARASIFYFISLIVENEKTCTVFFQDKVFITAFSVLFSELPIRSFALSIFSRGFQVVPYDVAISLLMNYVLFITNSVVNIDNESYVSLIQDLLFSLMNSLKQRKELTRDKTFSHALDQITNFLPRLENNEFHKNLYFSLLTFFIELSDCVEISQNTVSMIASVTFKLYDNEPPKELYEKLIQYMKGDNNADLSPEFIIKIPVGLRLFLQIFLNSPNLCQDAINFTNQMIHFNRENAKLISKAEIDLFILSQVETCDFKMVPLILDLFKKIASIESTPLVVKQFFSLISPVENQLKPYHVDLIDTLWELVSSAYFRAKSTNLVGNKVQCAEHIITNDQLNKGFSLAFWMRIHRSDRNDNGIPIFIIQFDQESQLIIKEKNYSFDITFSNYGDEKKLNFPIAHKQNDWVLYILTFEYFSDTEKLVATYNSGHEQLEIGSFSINNKVFSYFDFIIGSDNCSPSSDHSIELGSCFLSQCITQRQINDLHSFAPLSNCPSLVKPLAEYNPTKSSINNKSILEDRSSFTFCLVKMWKLDLALPLFSLFDTPLPENQSSYKSNISDIISIFSYALGGSDFAQRNFFEFKKFAHISTMLLQYPAHLLTYDLYLNFYSMYLSLDNMNTKKEIFHYILAQPYIWISSPADDHLCILKHWSSSLFPSAYEFITEVRPLKQMFTIVSLFYWSYFIGSFCIGGNKSKRIRDPNLDIPKCREEIIKCIKFVASFSFTRDDFIDLLLVTQKVAEDEDQVLSLLDLIDNLIQIIPIFPNDSNPENPNISSGFIEHSPYKTSSIQTTIPTTVPNMPSANFGVNIPFNQQLLFDDEIVGYAQNEIKILKTNFIEIDNLSPLHELISKGSEKIIWRVFKIVLVMHQKDILPLHTFYSFINVLILSLSAPALSEWFFYQCLESLKLSPAFFGIMCFFVDTHPTFTGEFIKFLPSIAPLDSYCKNVIWFEWPLMLCFDIDNQYKLDFINYIVTSRKDSIINLLSSIEIAYRALLIASKTTLTQNQRLKYDLVRGKFLEVIADNVVKGTLQLSEQHYSFLMSEIMNYIFLHHSYASKTLISAFIDSPFVKELNEEIIKYYQSLYNEKDLNQQANIMQLQFVRSFMLNNHFRHINIDNEQLYFGLRLTDKGGWVDLPVAKLFVTLTRQKEDQKYLPEALFICTQIAHFDHSFVTEFITSMKISSSNIFSLLISAISKNNNKKEKSGKPCPWPLQICEKITNQLFIKSPLLKKILADVQKIHSDITSIAELLINNVSQRSDNEEQILYKSAQNLNMDIRESAKKWNQIWSSLTAEKCPWSSLSHIEVLRWKRDDTHCFAFCPSRMKLNKHFNSHEDASFKRDNMGLSKEQMIKSQKTDTEMDNNLNEDDNEESEMAKKLSKHHESADQFIYHTQQMHIISHHCKLIKPLVTRKGNFVLTKTTIELLLNDYDLITIPLSEIKYAFFRTRYHRKNSIEIFTLSGLSYFIYFVDLKTNSLEILNHIQSVAPKSVIIQNNFFSPYFNSLPVTEQWVNGKMSNFEYLMNLNIHSGRSFSNHSQYPIFPLICIEANKKELNFADPTIYRDLSKPIGALNQARLDALFNEMKERELLFDPDKYLYTSGPVSRLTICIFLLRMEPFTSLHIDLQSGRFDIPDRQLTSINDLVHGIYNTPQDFRELIPEFYFQPEFLTNINNFDLGKTNTGESISNIILPPWASTPIEYIYLNRKCLESDYVSRHLNEWIDLIWGYKQRGEESVRANNTFIPKLYEDVWDKVDPHMSPKQRRITSKQIKTFLNMIGQIPAQLFKTGPHPQKKIIDNINGTVNPTSTNVTALTTRCKDCVFAHFTNERLTLVSSHGTLYIYEQEEGNLNLLEQNDISQQSFVKLLQNTEAKDLLFRQVGTDFFIAAKKGENNLFMYNLRKGTTLSIPSPHQSITNISGNGMWYCTVGTENATNIYRNDHLKRIIYTTQNYRDSITCTCISDIHKVLINGTRDGALIITSLTNGIILRIIDLYDSIQNDNQQIQKNFVPINVVVTDCWGFVVVLIADGENMAANRLSVFTINGIHIKTIKFDIGMIMDMCVWSSSRGFDYLALITDLGKIFIAEVFYLNFTIVAPGIRPPLANFFYSHTTNSLVAVEQTGRILYIPYIPPSW